MSRTRSGLLGIALCLALGQAGRAEEVAASEVVKVSHAEGYTFFTQSYIVSEAIVWRKGAKKQGLLLAVEHNKGPKRYFTLTHPSPDVSVAEGPGIKYVVNQKKAILTIQSGGKKTEEKFKKVVDS